MAVLFNAINENFITLKVDGRAQKDEPVTLVSNETAKACSEGESIIGIVKNVHNGYATVQISGVLTMPYTGTAPTVGFAAIDADGKNGAKLASSGRNVMVISVDTKAGNFTSVFN